MEDVQRLTTEEIGKILNEYGITEFDVYLYKNLSPDTDLWIINDLMSGNMFTLYSTDENIAIAPDGAADVPEIGLSLATPLLTHDGSTSVPYVSVYYLFAGKHGVR